MCACGLTFIMHSLGSCCTLVTYEKFLLVCQLLIRFILRIVRHTLCVSQEKRLCLHHCSWQFRINIYINIRKIMINYFLWILHTFLNSYFPGLIKINFYKQCEEVSKKKLIQKLYQYTCKTMNPFVHLIYITIWLFRWWLYFIIIL